MTAQAVRTGLSMVELPGRFQIVPGQPTLVLDVAHNPHSVAALTANLDAMGYFPTTHAVFGAMADKDWEPMLTKVGPLVDRWYFTDLPTPRADSAENLKAKLQQLQALVAAQNDQARTTLERLTTERDAAQAQVDTQHQQQEMADAQARQEIARLHSELERSGPVRVRISAQPAPACGPGGGGAPGHPSAAADPGAADAAPAYGLLPAANSARLAGVIQEIETLNAAYASCRSLLLHP
ncbi:hypothetical protein SDC9_165847 [bioreactor metagenome]|uniref:Mur ligase C-terminal domain-containing protein n=1 Tax=bioreactor metagenome TaxID=1076179 RepID=A0A645FVL6_9ZZZZ